MKWREKRLLEQISCNFSEQTSTILAEQERKEKRKIKKGKRSERADTFAVVQTSEQSVDTGSEHEGSYAITKDIHDDIVMTRFHSLDPVRLRTPQPHTRGNIRESMPSSPWPVTMIPGS